MRIVCLVDGGTKKLEEVLNLLKKLGYKEIIPYTTNTEEKDNKLLITIDEFNSLKEKDILFYWIKEGDNYIGYPHPIGSKYHAVIINNEGYQRLKEIYKKQVIGVSMLSNTSNTLDSESQVDLIVDGNKDNIEIVADILEYVREVH